jgi:hypothetical protein
MTIVDREAELYRMSEAHARLLMQRQEIERQAAELERQISLAQVRLDDARKAEAKARAENTE